MRKPSLRASQVGERLQFDADVKAETRKRIEASRHENFMLSIAPLVRAAARYDKEVRGTSKMRAARVGKALSQLRSAVAGVCEAASKIDSLITPQDIEHDRWGQVLAERTAVTAEQNRH